mgnify:CR=1 FL=1
MKFYSTNNKDLSVTFKNALMQGMPLDNGLFMPQYIPNHSKIIKGINTLSFQDISFVVSKSFLEEDFNKQSGIKFIDGSLMANTIVLEVEDNDIEISTLNDLLENWGCTIESISYRILSSIK